MWTWLSIRPGIAVVPQASMTTSALATAIGIGLADKVDPATFADDRIPVDERLAPIAADYRRDIDDGGANRSERVGPLDKTIRSFDVTRG